MNAAAVTTVPGASTIRCQLARDALLLALAEMDGACTDYEVACHEARAYGALSMALVLGGVDTEPSDWTNLIRRRADARRNVLLGLRQQVAAVRRVG